MKESATTYKLHKDRDKGYNNDVNPFTDDINPTLYTKVLENRR